MQLGRGRLRRSMLDDADPRRPVGPPGICFGIFYLGLLTIGVLCWFEFFAL